MGCLFSKSPIALLAVDFTFVVDLNFSSKVLCAFVTFNHNLI